MTKANVTLRRLKLAILDSLADVIDEIYALIATWRSFGSTFGDRK